MPKSTKKEAKKIIKQAVKKMKAAREIIAPKEPKMAKAPRPKFIMKRSGNRDRTV